MNVLKSWLKSFPEKHRNRSLLLLASISVMLFPLFMSSCGNDYKTASERDPKVNVLISAVTLNDWIDPDKGYPEDKYGQNKVVVLHVGADYKLGHIPGAYELTIDNISGVRSDGVSNTSDMVSTKAQIDKVIQNAGIDGSAVIVLTSKSGSFADLAWTYFNFRYWGFPRSKLRVLDGFVDLPTNPSDPTTGGAWIKAGYELDLAVPKTPEATEYSVCNLTQEPDRFRVPLEDMIKVAEDDNPKTVVIDSRSAAEYNGTSTTLAGSNYVAFEGHIRSAQWQEYTQLLKTDGTFLDKEPIDEITPVFSSLAVPVDSTTTAYVYSRSGVESAAVTFLALDGVLNYSVRLYDGGWLEWGQMTVVADDVNTAATEKGLSQNSPWRTDDTASVAVTYNADVVPAVIVDALSSYSFIDSDAANANAVNEEDRVICFEGGGGDAGGY